MYFLDAEQTHTRLGELGFKAESLKSAMSSHPSVPAGSKKQELREDFVTGYLAAKQAVDHIGNFTSCLLYIHSMGGRLSLENSHLYERLRRSYGETRPNYAAPGHVFYRHDLFDLISFCELVANYRFAAVLIQHSSRAWVSFAQDDSMYLVAEK